MPTRVHFQRYSWLTLSSLTTKSILRFHLKSQRQISEPAKVSKTWYLQGSMSPRGPLINPTWSQWLNGVQEMMENCSHQQIWPWARRSTSRRARCLLRDSRPCRLARMGFNKRMLWRRRIKQSYKTVRQSSRRRKWRTRRRWMELVEIRTSLLQILSCASMGRALMSMGKVARLRRSYRSRKAHRWKGRQDSVWESNHST